MIGAYNYQEIHGIYTSNLHLLKGFWALWVDLGPILLIAGHTHKLLVSVLARLGPVLLRFFIF